MEARVGSLRLRAGVLLALVSSCLAARESRLAFEIEAWARSLAPGEPLRIVVRSSTPLDSLEGVFLGEPVLLVRSGNAASGREQWSGWALVDLEQSPGPARIKVWGRTEDGLEVLGTRDVVIARKRFPTQRLEVDSKYVTPPPEIEARMKREKKRLAEIFAVRRPTPPPSTPFIRPVPGEATSIFGTRRVFNGKPRAPHPGLDLRAPTGTPVKAAGAGRVTLAEELYFSGNTVILDHGAGLFTVYAHLSSLLVQEGDEARTGQVVGLSGATGRVTGPHLHWGAKVGDRPFDPTALLDPRLFQ